MPGWGRGVLTRDLFGAYVPIFCPACVAVIPRERVEWDAIRATCPGCDLMIVLDGDLVPQRPVPGFPDKLLAMRASEPPPPGARLVIERDGRRSRIRLGGLVAWISKSVEIDPRYVAVRPLLGRSHRLDTADVPGAVPIQHVAWYGESPRRRLTVTWHVHLVGRSEWPVLYMFDDWAAAQHVAATITEAVVRAREAGSAYRG